MLSVELTMDQTSLQNLHTLLSDDTLLLTPESPREQPVEHLGESKVILQKSALLHRIDPQGEIRASKRLCLPGSPNEPIDHDVLKLLVGRVSSIIQSDSGGTMAELCTSVQ